MRDMQDTVNKLYALADTGRVEFVDFVLTLMSEFEDVNRRLNYLGLQVQDEVENLTSILHRALTIYSERFFGVTEAVLD